MNNKLTTQNTTLTQISQTLFNKDGLRGFYRGGLLSIGGCMPFVAIRMSTYDYLMTRFKPILFTKQQEDARELRFLAFNCIVGSIAGIAAISICYPFDLVRRMLHLNGIGDNPKFNGTFDVIGKLIAQEGVHGLYKGFWMTIVKAAPASAIMFVTNEQIKKLIMDE